MILSLAHLLSASFLADTYLIQRVSIHSWSRTAAFVLYARRAFCQRDHITFLWPMKWLNESIFRGALECNTWDCFCLRLALWFSILEDYAFDASMGRARIIGCIYGARWFDDINAFVWYFDSDWVSGDVYQNQTDLTKFLQLWKYNQLTSYTAAVLDEDLEKNS